MIISMGGYNYCDGATRDLNKNGGPLNGMEMDGIFTTDFGQYVRAATLKGFDRGNQGVQLSFTVSRKFSTVAAADDYALMLYSTVPRNGTLQFTLDDSSVRNMTGAQLIGLRIAPEGVTRRIRWSFKGGLPA